MANYDQTVYFLLSRIYASIWYLLTRKRTSVPEYSNLIKYKTLLGLRLCVSHYHCNQSLDATRQCHSVEVIVKVHRLEHEGLPMYFLEYWPNFWDYLKNQIWRSEDSNSLSCFTPDILRQYTCIFNLTIQNIVWCARSPA